MPNYWLSEFEEKKAPDMEPVEDPEDQVSDDSEDGTNSALSNRQQSLYKLYEMAVEEFGMFDKSSGPDGAHYAPADKNPFKEEGLVCNNCEFYLKSGNCELVSGKIEPEAICKLWIIPKELIKK